MKDQVARRGSVRRPPLRSVLVGIIPFIAMGFSVALWDRLEPNVLGLPFNLFWLALWILLTPLCMAGAYRLDTPDKPKNLEGPKDTSR